MWAPHLYDPRKAPDNPIKFQIEIRRDVPKISSKYESRIFNHLTTNTEVQNPIGGKLVKV